MDYAHQKTGGPALAYEAEPVFETALAPAVEAWEEVALDSAALASVAEASGLVVRVETAHSNAMEHMVTLTNAESLVSLGCSARAARAAQVQAPVVRRSASMQGAA